MRGARGEQEVRKNKKKKIGGGGGAGWLDLCMLHKRVFYVRTYIIIF